MNGQGSPPAAHARSCERFAIAVLRLCVVCCALGLGNKHFVAVAQAANRELDMRLRIVWHGPEPKLWRGTIGLPNGQLSDLRLLSIDAEQPSCFVIPQNPVATTSPTPLRSNLRPTAPTQITADRLYVSSRSEGNRYGIDIHVRGPSDASLVIDLNESAKPIRIPLRDLIRESHEEDLGDGYKLHVGRCPGDRIRIRTNRASMVFWPGEKMKIDAVAHEINARPNSTLRARFRIRRAGGNRSKVSLWNLGGGDGEQWYHEETVKVDSSGTARPITDVGVEIPSEAGVYNLDLDLLAPLRQVGSLARRRVQFIVVSKSDSLTQPDRRSIEPEVTEFNNLNEPRKIYDLPQLPQLPQMPQWPLSQQRGHWGSSTPQPWSYAGRRWTRLEANEWQAYSLRVRKVGVPHIVDIELPTGFPQNLVFSVVEPGSESIASSVQHSGLYVGDPDIQLTQQADGSTGHRITFWPRSTNSIVMIANRSTDSAAAFGRIRVEAYPKGLPSNLKRESQPTFATSHSITAPDLVDPDRTVDQTLKQKSYRQRIAVVDAEYLKQLLLTAQSRSVDKNVAPLLDRPQFDDWRTFQEMAKRLVTYLRFAGYDGVALAAWGKGSSLYPTEQLHPSPQLDRGVLSSSGQDPFRKDVLELLFRVFDREGLTLIPAIDFSSPLTELEQQLPLGISSRGIELVDLRMIPDENGGLKHVPRLGQSLKEGDAAPYYNPLDARVQTAMLNVVQELSSRYGKHTSFGGIRIDLAGRGFTQLPGIGWGFDVQTMADFHQSLRSDPSRRPVPMSAADTMQRLRQQIVQGQRTELIEAWIRWRQQKLSIFYDRLATVVASPSDGNFAVGPSSLQPKRLYLSAAGLLDSAPWQRHLRPKLPREIGLGVVMQETGLDLNALQANDKIVVLRPEAFGSLENLAAQAVGIESRAQDIQQAFSSSRFHAAEFRHSVETFDLEQLNASPSKLGISEAAQYIMSYDGLNGRRPYAQALSRADDQVIFEGGVAVPIGQENAVRKFVEVYRQLPTVDFETLPLKEASPLVLRSATHEGQTFVYAVNASPWIVNANFHWNNGQDKSADVGVSTTPGTMVAPDLRQEDVKVVGTTDFRIADSFGHLDVSAVVEPYGLVLFRVASPNAQLKGCRAELPATIDKRRSLRVHLDDVQVRAEALKESETKIALIEDPGFERPLKSAAHGSTAIQNQNGFANAAVWTENSDGGTVELDSVAPAEGMLSLRLEAVSKAVSVASQPFAVPTTGRLTVSFKIRAARPMESPLEVEISANGANYVSNMRINKMLTTEYQTASVTFADLPVNAAALQLRFHMAERGEVWIDDLQTSDKSLSLKEKKELDRMLHVTYGRLRAGDFTACYDTLSGYWPRFLMRYVDPPTAEAPRVETLPERTVRREPKKPPLMDRFFKAWRRVPTLLR